MTPCRECRSSSHFRPHPPYDLPAYLPTSLYDLNRLTSMPYWRTL